MVSKPRRFGICSHSGLLQEWESRCIAALEHTGGAIAVVRIALAGPSTRKPIPLFAPALQRMRPSESAVPTIDWETGAADRIRALDLDFIVSFDASAPPPELTGAATGGVWYFRFGDGDAPDAAPGFWECFDGADTAGAALIAALPGGLDSALRRGCVAVDQMSPAHTADLLLAEIANWPALASAALDTGAGVRGARASPRGRKPPVRRASLAAALVMAFKIAARRIVRSIDVFYVDRWNVGIAHAPIDSFLSGRWPRVEWLPELSAPFYRADPFGLRAGAQTFACVERYDGGRSIGMIEAIEIEEGQWTGKTSTMLSESFHLSYPFVIEENGTQYCIPEAYDNHAVSLYRAVDPPRVWEKVSTLLDDVEAVDATIFVHEGRHWLFCTEYAEPRHHRLLAFYADSLAGPYRAHPGNPVQVDPRCAGCAGTPFVAGGMLIRPAQDCSRRYGAAVSLKRIVELTPSVFREEPVTTVSPHPRYPAGVHTLSALGAMTLVDGKRRVFTLRRVFWRITSALRRIVSRGIPVSLSAGSTT
jgi:hypothetical protein